ncbi:MAG: sulfite exporter TauE/SafE family protein [Sediminibacterium sp.]|nr:sulfite exporter TauE/SafE family protein [Sediminibacterium sp.]
MDILIISAFLVGLGGSVHCVGMCGPLVLAMPFSAFTGARKWIALVIYNVGRVISYAAIGALVGLVGRGINWFGLTQIISIVLGAIILISVILPYLFKRVHISMPGIFNQMQIRVLQFLVKKQQVGWMFIAGMMNGLLPCGLVYMAVAAAVVAGTIQSSILFMTFFGLGTIPTMIMVVLIGQQMPISIRGNLKKFVPVLSLIIGCLLVLRGLNLNIPFLSPYMNENLTGVNTVECPTH